MNILVGYTGFVGSNIYAHGDFQGAFNSKNISEAYGLAPELLVYAGLRAEKFLANSAPEKDMQLILQAEDNIARIAPKKLVLISTIDVFPSPKGVDETTPIDPAGMQAYGYDRLMLERWVRENYPDALIIRLPGLFGKNIKKNFIFDYIRRIPSMLRPEKLDELSRMQPEIAGFYTLEANGFYKCRALTADEERGLKAMLKETGFSALNFTDSRSVYQFYPLSRLWGDICTALSAGLTLFHPATEPVSAGELYEYLSGEPFVNELGGTPADYDYRTVHSALFGRSDGYICGKKQVMREIKQFVESY